MNAMNTPRTTPRRIRARRLLSALFGTSVGLAALALPACDILGGDEPGLAFQYTKAEWEEISDPVPPLTLAPSQKGIRLDGYYATPCANQVPEGEATRSGDDAITLRVSPSDVDVCPDQPEPFTYVAEVELAPGAHRLRVVHEADLLREAIITQEANTVVVLDTLLTIP